MHSHPSPLGHAEYIFKYFCYEKRVSNELNKDATPLNRPNGMGKSSKGPNPMFRKQKNPPNKLKNKTKQNYRQPRGARSEKNDLP